MGTIALPATTVVPSPAQAVHTPKAWRSWLALVVLDAFLLSPLAIDETRRALSVEGADKLLAFSVPASLLWLAAFHVWVPRVQRLHLFLAPLHLATAFDLFLVLHYRARLSSSTLSVMLDNGDSALGYISGHLGELLALALVVVGAYALAVHELGALTLKVKPVRWWWPLSALLVVYLTVGAKQARAANSVTLGALDVLSHDRNSPLGVVPQAAIAWQVHRLSAAPERRAPLGARRVDASTRRVVVLVLGESARPDHWGLYGYRRQTTPRLAARGDLLVFRDAVSQAALTSLSVPLMLGRGDATEPERIGKEPTIVTAFREAGFRTEWLSTQQRDHWTGQLNRQANEAAQQLYFERRMDGALVTALERSLAEAKAAGESLFVVLHTQGSHFAYRDRVPHAFAHFAGGRMVDEYDDSVRYTDEVLDELLGLLAREPAETSLLYVADHGENLQDDERKLVGHFFSNQWDLPVPMLLWLSPKWVEAHPEAAAAARANVDRRLSTRAVFHSLADLGGITIDGDQGFATRSVLRDTFEDQPRRFLRADETIGDFDRSFPR